MTRLLIAGASVIYLYICVFVVIAPRALAVYAALAGHH